MAIRPPAALSDFMLQVIGILFITCRKYSSYRAIYNCNPKVTHCVPMKKESTLDILVDMHYRISTLRKLFDKAIVDAGGKYSAFCCATATKFANNTLETYNKFPGITPEALQRVLITFRKSYIVSHNIRETLKQHEEGFADTVQLLRANPNRVVPVSDFACSILALFNETRTQLEVLQEKAKDPTNAASFRKLALRLGLTNTGA